MRVLVVNNMLSGSGDAGLYDFVHALGHRDCDVMLRFFRGHGRLSDLVKDANAFDRVVAAGGDGTVSTIAYAIRDSGVPLMAYPAGTANIIAANLGIPLEPSAAADVTMDGVSVDFDLGEVTHLGSSEPLSPAMRTGFMQVSGVGFDAAIMDAAQPLKASMGVLAYVAGVMQNLAPKRASFKVVLDGEEIAAEGIAVLVVNFGRLQFDLSITHDSDPRDGVFEVAIVRSRTAVGLLPAVWDALLDRVVERPERGPLEIRRARAVLIEAEPPLRLQYDGEVLDQVTPFGVRVLPRASRLIVPESSRDFWG